MAKISSRQNGEVKKLRQLHTVKGRKKYREFLLEGPQVLKEVASDFPPKRLYYREGYLGFLPQGIPCIEVEKSIFNQLSPSENSQGVLAVYDFFPQEDKKPAEGLNLYLDGIQDPGNLGGLLRSAAAFGVAKVFLSQDCVDLYNPKVIRSTMSAFFKLSYAYLSHEDLACLEGLPLLRADLSGQPLPQFAWPQTGLLILGNEAHGVHEDLRKISTGLHIPMEASMESLNVNVAGSICMYDYYVKNQRREA